MRLGLQARKWSQPAHNAAEGKIQEPCGLKISLTCLCMHTYIDIYTYVYTYMHTHTNLARASVCTHLRDALNTKPSLSISRVGCPAEMTVGVSPLQPPTRIVE